MSKGQDSMAGVNISRCGGNGREKYTELRKIIRKKVVRARRGKQDSLQFREAQLNQYEF